jgi:hypothetical protein
LRGRADGQAFKGTIKAGHPSFHPLVWGAEYSPLIHIQINTFAMSNTAPRANTSARRVPPLEAGWTLAASLSSGASDTESFTPQDNAAGVAQPDLNSQFSNSQDMLEIETAADTPMMEGGTFGAGSPLEAALVQELCSSCQFLNLTSCEHPQLQDPPPPPSTEPNQGDAVPIVVYYTQNHLYGDVFVNAGDGDNVEQIRPEEFYHDLDFPPELRRSRDVRSEQDAGRCI